MAGFANGLAALMQARGAVPANVPPGLPAGLTGIGALPAGVPNVNQVAAAQSAAQQGAGGIPPGWQAALAQIAAQQQAPPQGVPANFPGAGLSPQAIQAGRAILAGRR